METRLIGKIISRRFRVEDIIGRGGMAIVYRAFDLKTHQMVALKVLREEYETDPEYKERFEREAQVCKRLNHPNVVNAIDSGVVSGVSFIAMEYVDGQTLKEFIAQTGRMEQGEAVRCTLQILSALAHAHQRGVVHRDMKPQNVMVARSGQIKLADFGIAGVADTKTLTSDGNIMGSVHYFSPEQAKGMKATAASDLYSVGVMLYEMLTGHVPFEGETSVSVAMKHLMETAKPVEEESGCCRALALIVRKALEKQPNSRYQNADAMTRDLRRALRHPDGEFMQIAVREEEAQKRKQGRRNRKRGRAQAVIRAVSLAAALMIVCGIAFAGYKIYASMFLFARMPDLSGVDVATAEKMIESAGLVPDLDYAYSDMAEGYVCHQLIAAGESVPRGQAVSVTISRGSDMLSVQRFVGMTQDAATAAILAQGFTVGAVIVEPSEQLRGTVIAQSPDLGQSARMGSPVNLTVSGGRVVVPELVGEREEEAIARIADLGLVRGLITYESVEDARQDGIVLGQSLERFDVVLPGTMVEMSVGYYDKRRYTAAVQVNVTVPQEGAHVRVTLVGPDGKESDMYAATHSEPGDYRLDVLLRSEQSGVMTWRLYLDGGFRSEATAVLQ